MALREVLTHQGTCVGIFMPDQSFDGPLFSETKNKGKGMTMKREREIDLNMQVPEAETQTNLKRPKVEDSSSPLTVTTISGSGNGNFDACVKVEDCRRSLSTSQANGQLNFTPVNIETESCIDDHTDLDMAKEKGSCEDKYPVGKMDVLKSLPEDCELMNLVKLARHSWVKNCEFLQDSAIRFLCVLSLDR